MAIRFVEPVTKILTLADGTRLTIRHELNAGEQVEMSNRIRRQPEEAGFFLTTAYLLDWTVPDTEIRGLGRGDLDPIVRRLAFDSVLEIKQAIEAHQAEVDAAREEKKTSPAIASASDPISTSVS